VPDVHALDDRVGDRVGLVRLDDVVESGDLRVRGVAVVDRRQGERVTAGRAHRRDVGQVGGVDARVQLDVLERVEGGQQRVRLAGAQVVQLVAGQVGGRHAVDQQGDLGLLVDGEREGPARGGGGVVDGVHVGGDGHIVEFRQADAGVVRRNV